MIKQTQVVKKAMNVVDVCLAITVFTDVYLRGGIGGTCLPISSTFVSAWYKPCLEVLNDYHSACPACLRASTDKQGANPK